MKNISIANIKFWLKANGYENIAVVFGVLVLLIVSAKFLIPKVKRKAKRRRVTTARRTTTRRKAGNTTKSVTGANLRVPSGKKPWQVKGSLAARRRMALIRRKRKQTT